MDPIPTVGAFDHGPVGATVDSDLHAIHDLRMDMSGELAGAFVQAGTVHGDVHFHGPSRPAVIPRQVAAPPMLFVNRGRELAALDSALRGETGVKANGSRIVALTGLGGVGKTALVCRWVHGQRDRFPDGVLHAELTAPSGDPVDPVDVLGAFLRALGVPSSEVPETLAERRGLYRSVTADRAMAVVLDDARSTTQVRELLPSSPLSCVLVTCRELLIGLLAIGGSRVQVRSFDEDCAIELLRQYLGADRVEAEVDAARAVAQTVGGLPLALGVAAAMTMARPESNGALEWTARSLAAAESRIDLLSSADDLRVRAVLDSSFRTLPSIAAQAYHALGVHRGIRFRVELVATALGIPDSGAQNAITALEEASLVTRLRDNEYQMHSLVHAHARTIVELEPRTPPAQLQQRMLAWYTHTAHAAVRAVMPARPAVAAPERDDDVVLPPQICDRRFAMTWLEANRGQLLAWATIAQELRQQRTVLQLADALHGVFLLYKEYSAAAEVYQMGLRAAMTLPDENLEFHMRKRHTRVLIRLGQTGQAHEQIARMLASARDAGNRRWEASALKTLGMLHASTGRPDLALLPLMDAWEILDELRRRRAIGLILIHIADVEAQGEHIDVAYEHAQQAKQILSELPTPDKANAARAAISLGIICVHTGRADEAARELHHAVKVLSECGSRADLARAHDGLAELYASIGDDPAAARHRTEANSLCPHRATLNGRSQ
ncbi:hypothetical protein AOZ06_05245 [Kibdelosporangium phytohabitans]|uniref:Uncharacterized protein n=2 Tax=Kibdelosporangium phytohabitans TaxID=860235 RepID=A0A0N9HWF0_9PSEU|nr:hypothetical protein AOZ06_05245 [Kibdelosporangium phytohabitans]